MHGTLAAASHFEVTEAMIRKCTIDRQILQEIVDEVEDAIYNWVVKKREENRAVTVKLIRTKAKDSAEEHGHQNFKASLSVRRRTSFGQPLPSDHLQKRSDFRKFVAAGALNVSPFNLRNIDKVPGLFDIIYEQTVGVKGRENIKIDSTSHEKSNFTVVLGVTAAGEKLKPMLIFKKNKIAVIPGGLTQTLQPLNVGINKPFEDQLKAGWEKWIRDEAKATYTKSGIRRRMSHEGTAFLVSESFQSVSSDVIQHSFKRA
ncbi:unnamed protein product [Haemonchus placei]|uniref:HTH CENPB-type domain-containing protein n=1 Tax=Haemonchus placei TaxID=6290 RepID=A0A3P7WNZ7_HAEPC|nr:unnamed protein product [Haemonchus placei]